MDKQPALEKDIISCFRITEYIFSEPSLNEFLRLVLSEAMQRMNAERGSVFLLDKTKQRLVGFAMTGIKHPHEVSLPINQGLVGHVAKTGEVINIPDAYADARFYSGVDKQTGYKTKSVLCSPIFASGSGETNEKNVCGIMELLNKKNDEIFDSQDEASIKHLLDFASVRLREYSLIESILQNQRRLETEIVRFQGYSDQNVVFQSFIGKSAKVEQLKQMIWTVAPYDSNVLIIGESGTGKELVARCLHGLSGRKKGAFVALNCAAVPESLLESELFGIEGGVATGVSARIGKIEQANGGTLFLDEIGEMSPSMQAKLLRVIQEKEIVKVGGKKPLPIDVRFVGATHRLLDSLVTTNNFREDLYYRLKVVEIFVPPLRERREDIAFLAKYFLEKLNDKYAANPLRYFSPTTLVHLESQQWPGNVRELQNEVERIFILGGDQNGEININLMAPHKESPHTQNIHETLYGSEQVDLEKGVLLLDVAGKSLASILENAEKLLVNAMLEKHAGNKSKVAEDLEISREGLRKMMHRWESGTKE